MQQSTILDDHTNGAPASDSQNRNKRTRFFTEWDRTKQLQAFFAWLPQEIQDIPGIDWTNISPKVLGYCVHTIKESPDATLLAIAMASAYGACTESTLRSFMGQLYGLFKNLRLKCGMTMYTDLGQEQIWQTYAALCQSGANAPQQLTAYAHFTTSHFPQYLQLLTLEERQRMQVYTLPSLPPDYRKRYFPHKSRQAKREARRKADTDILVPLYPVLRQLVRFRKQLAERVLRAIREARHKVETGEEALPFHFEHTDLIPQVNHDARTVADIQIVGREVTMKFILWDKPSWVLHHTKRYKHAVISDARGGRAAYVPDLNCFFVQFNGPSSDLLWIGDLIEHRLLHQFQKEGTNSPEYQKRWDYARQLGFSNGCITYRSGVLSPGDPWFADHHQEGDLLFEPESLYRAVLFGSAMAMIALSNGSRVSELLQVSCNKERRITRTETVMLLDANGQPRYDEKGSPMTKQVKIYLQHLLPKGAKTEEERQLFPLSLEAMRLLGEIKAMLEEAHGEVPVVQPSRSSSKYEHLQPEQYLFQWAAASDGAQGVFSVQDVQVLLRFVLHGLDLSTSQGKPIHVSAHVLRHVMATHARHYRNVPPEAIAYFFLHHRLKALTGHAPLLSDISEYYTLMTEEQRFAVIRADLDEQEEIDHTLLHAAPTGCDLEQMNEDLRIIFELWHTLHPTALGYCGCPGLCPRGTDRALCLGCSYLVTDPERIGAALSWLNSYVQQAEQFELQGNLIDARQARIKVQLLDDVINVMRLQLQAEADGAYIPLHKVLPSPYDKQEGRNEKG